MSFDMANEQFVFMVFKIAYIYSILSFVSISDVRNTKFDVVYFRKR